MKTYHLQEQELDLIEAYLADQLDDTLQSNFQERKRSDAAWMDKVNQVRLTQIAIREIGLQEQMQAWPLPTNENITPAKIKTIWLKRLAIAAVLLIGIFGIGRLFLSGNKDEKLFATYYQPDPGLPTHMGISENYLFDKAMVAYKTQHYQEAIDQWKNLLTTNKDNDTLLYFIGSAYLADNNTKHALPYFDQIILSKQSAFLKDAQWYKALIVLKEGKREEAKKLIELSEKKNGNSLLQKLTSQ